MGSEESTRDAAVTDMDATAIIISAIAAVPLTVTAYASVLSARRSKDAKVNSAAARRSSERADKTTSAAALSQKESAGNVQQEILFLTHMVADHLADNSRHLDRRSSNG